MKTCRAHVRTTGVVNRMDAFLGAMLTIALMLPSITFNRSHP